MKTLNNHTQILIGKNIIRTGGADGLVGTVVQPSVLAVGEVVVTDVDGTILDSSTVASKQTVVLVQGQGPTLPLIKSANIYKAGVFSYLAKAFSFGVEEVEFIGYNPVATTGSIEVINNNPYIVRSSLKSNQVEFADKEMFVLGDYVSDGSATQSEIAKGITANLIRNSERFPNIPYTVARVNDAATLTAFTGTGVMIKVTKGSKTVEFMDAAGVASTGSITIGDVINIPTSGGQSFSYTATADAFTLYLGTTAYVVADAGSGAQNATAQAAAINAGTQATAVVTSSTTVTVTLNNGIQLPPLVVYDTINTVFVAVTIASGDAVPTKYIAAGTVSAAASFQLDIAYQGETGFIADGTTMATNSGVATAQAAGAWGIKMLGKPKAFITNVLVYEKNKWYTTIQNAGVTPVAITTTATEGTGRYEQIADEEYMYFLAEGGNDSVTIQIPPVTNRVNVETTGRYSIVDIRWQQTYGSNAIQNPTAFKQIRIACNKNGGFITNNQFNTSGSPNSSVVRVLDAWLSTFSAQVGNL